MENGLDGEKSEAVRRLLKVTMTLKDDDLKHQGWIDIDRLKMYFKVEYNVIFHD